MLLTSTAADQISYEKCQKPTESIYACYCRWMEELNGLGLLPNRSLKAYNQLPLIIYDKAKAQRVLDWIRGDFTGDLHLPFSSCIIADPIGVVTLEKLRVLTREEALHTMFMDRHAKPHHSFGEMEQEAGEEISEVLLVNFTAFIDIEDSQPAINPEAAPVNLISVGTAVVYHVTNKKHRYTKFVDMVSLAKHPTEGYVAIGGPDTMRITGDSLGTAVDQLQYLAQPGNYVIQVTPKKVRDPNKTSMMIRAHERRRVVILDPEEMHKIYPKQQGGAHASPVPHLRMGHWRTFHADRYKGKRGQRIWIEEIKVKAGEQWELGGKTYKVMERSSD